jgi:hypothetical protein
MTENDDRRKSQVVQDKETFYSPEKLPREEIQVTNGTAILLKDIKRQRLGRGATALRKRLARRFSVAAKRTDSRF